MKTKKRKIPTTIEAGIPIREVRPGYYLVDCYHHGKRERQCFRDLVMAKAHCQALRIKVRNEGLSFLALNSKQRADAIEALTLLAGRASLVEAAQAFNTLNPVGVVETVAQTVQRYLETMRVEGARPISINEKRQKLTKLADAYGDRPTSSLIRDHLNTLADKLGYQGTNRTKYIGAWQSALNLYAGTRRTAASTGDKKPAETFHPDVVRKLFSVAAINHPDVAPVLALLFFAGLRPEEVQRMTWEAIKIGEGYIDVAPSMSKTRDGRHVTIQKNLSSWLMKYRRARGPVAPTKAATRRLRELVMRKAGLTEWPNDVARHTFATAHFTAFKDSGDTCKELGHFGSQSTFVRHYKGLMTEAEAKAFWSITPEAIAGAGKVINQTENTERATA
ncbi:MAG TPA: hypothetical protein PKC67_09920 [Kiritimatiellia bacterium]|nr:hypothetical protein [Kiritimatiellia bacterium]HMP34656.1 hypothetical protein [Kiritimatiellia bacterium]